MNRKLKVIENIDIKNKTVIIRCNLDVTPFNSSIEDNNKIKAIIPTLQYLIKNNCKIIILSHFGIPTGKYIDDLSLMSIRFEIGRLLQKQLKFANIAQSENSIKFMDFGDILLLENLGFSPEETSESSLVRRKFVKKISQIADFYINESFGVFEKYASVLELPSLMKSFAGFSFQNEFTNLEKLVNDSISPFTLILGGKNLNEKFEEVSNISDKFDNILIGAESTIDENLLNKIKKIIQKGKTKIYLPLDYTALNSKNELVNIDASNITEDVIPMDIGLKTIELYKEQLKLSKTILWDGSLGNCEIKDFIKGTQSIAEFLTLETSESIFKVINGDNLVNVINFLKVKTKRFNHISNSDRMLLKFLSNKRFEVIDKLIEK